MTTTQTVHLFNGRSYSDACTCGANYASAVHDVESADR